MFSPVPADVLAASIYASAVPAAFLFIVLGAVHDWSMMAFCVPGLFSYFLDRTDYSNRTALGSRFHRVTAKARVMTDEWLRLDVVASCSSQLGASVLSTPDAAFGTQFVYLRLPALGKEAHAFSLAARSLSIVVKASGDWTRRLHSLVMEQAAGALVMDTVAAPHTAAPQCGIEGAERSDAPPIERLSCVTTDLVCEIDGVYGNAAPPWRSYSHVLFVGGGVGVTPWLPAMEEHAEHCRLHGVTEQQTMRLIWCGRTYDELDAMSPYLPEDTTVFLTRTDTPIIAPPLEPAQCEGSAAARECSNVVAHDAEHDRSDAGCGGEAASPDIIGRGGTRPWLFAFVGVTSLCLADLSYYYLRGLGSIYVDYERGCGECKSTATPTRVASIPCRAHRHLLSSSLAR